jgi:hypothetical protein
MLKKAVGAAVNAVAPVKTLGSVLKTAEQVISDLDAVAARTNDEINALELQIMRAEAKQDILNEECQRANRVATKLRELLA